MGEVQRLHKSHGRAEAPPASAQQESAHAPARAPAGPSWASAAPAAPFALGGVQRKVAIGASNDAYEREADSVAGRVAGGQKVSPGAISSISPASLNPVGQRQAKSEEKKKDEKPAAAPVQREVKPEDKTKDAKSAMPVQREAKPPEKKKDEKPAAAPVQRADKPAEKKKDEKAAAPPIQRAAKPEEKKKDDKAAAPVQRNVRPEDKKKLERDSSAPVQMQSKPEEKKKDDKAAAPVQRAAKPDEKKKDEKPAAAPVQRESKPDDKKKDDKAPASPVQRSTKPEEKKKDDKASAPVQRESKPDDKKKDEKPAAGPVQRMEGEKDPHKSSDHAVQTSRSDAAAASAPSMESAASNAIATKGPGEPINSSTRNTLESGLGSDLSDVRVHNDTTAHSAAEALNARAFTHQSDIWLGRGESQHNVPLMAHEATHVVQQTGSVHRQLVQRAGGKSGVAAKDANVSPEKAQEDLETFPLPPVKARHKPVYEAWAKAGTLKRVKGYERGEPDQKHSVWIPAVKDKIKGLEKLHLDSSFKGKKTIQVTKDKKKTGTYQELLEAFAAPDWDQHGANKSFEVDHIVELQVGSWDGGDSGPANTMENMELLDQRSNSSSGGSTRAGMRENVAEFLRRSGKSDSKDSVTKYLAANDVTFKKVRAGTIGTASPGDSRFWTRADIESGKQLEAAKPVKNPGEAGTATSFALLAPGASSLLGEFPHKAGALKIPISNEAEARRVAGLKIKSIQLNSGYELAKAPAAIGSIEAEWDLPKFDEIVPPKGALQLQLIKSAAGQYTGEIASLPDMKFSLKSASDIAFEKVGFEDGQVSGTGRLRPSIPLLEKIPIDVRLRGRALEFVYFYKPEDLVLPLPGITIDNTTLGIFFGTNGLGVEGSADLSVKGLGRGNLSARIDTNEGFSARGNFDFDSKLFDKFDVSIWYRSKKFGGSGVLTIAKPNKIRGIRSATIKATFSDDSFSADGTFQPSIPGVKEAGLSVAYSKEEGLTIGGNLQLADNIPGISSGSVDAKVTKRPDGTWSVSAHGKAVPKIPGITSSIDVTYDDGLFDITGTVAYQKGMLAGSVTVGATNRPIGDDGKPGPPPKGHEDKITFFGGGSVTLRLAPWLQATAAIKFKPNGEVEVTGEIGLPKTLDIFDEKKVQKNIFSIGIDIPIIGFSVLGQHVGIFLNIGGGLDLDAGIGPGQLQDVNLSVTYNPAHEEDTKVHGHAALHIPAHAGLRLAVHAALGAGIPIVDAKAGIELGGSLGIEGAAHADVDVDWTPKKGLVLDASASIYAEPKFKFDIVGYVLVEADLFIKTITLYEHKWNLASVEYGSGLRLGLKLPIHYEEGKPFNVSLSDIQFEVPHIDPMATLKGIFDKII
jgi:hypothetical protein